MREVFCRKEVKGVRRLLMGLLVFAMTFFSGTIIHADDSSDPTFNLWNDFEITTAYYREVTQNGAIVDTPIDYSQYAPATGGGPTIKRVKVVQTIKNTSTETKQIRYAASVMSGTEFSAVSVSGIVAPPADPKPNDRPDGTTRKLSSAFDIAPGQTITISFTDVAMDNPQGVNTIKIVLYDVLNNTNNSASATAFMIMYGLLTKLDDEITVPVQIYLNGQRLNDTIKGVVGKLVDGSAVLADEDNQYQNAVYEIDTKQLLVLKEIPGQYRLIDKIPPKLYVFLQQTAGQSGNVSFGTVVTDNTQLSFDGVKRYEGMIDGVSTPLYAFGGSESIYGETNRIDTLKAIAQSSDQTLSPFGAITLNTQTAVTGQFVYIDNQTGKEVGTQYFGNKESGDPVDNNDLVAPWKFIQTDRKSKYIYEPGNIEVRVTRVTDSKYSNPNVDGTGQTVQQATAGNAGLMANGLTLLEVPSFEGTASVRDLHITLSPQGDLRYSNMFDTKFHIMMATSAMNDGSYTLPVTSMVVNNQNIYQDGTSNLDGLTMGFGQSVLTGSGKSGTIPVGDMQLNLSNNGKATTYTGTITYSAIQDDLIDSAN